MSKGHFYIPGGCRYANSTRVVSAPIHIPKPGIKDMVGIAITGIVTSSVLKMRKCTFQLYFDHDVVMIVINNAFGPFGRRE